MYWKIYQRPIIDLTDKVYDNDNDAGGGGGEDDVVVVVNIKI